MAEYKDYGFSTAEATHAHAYIGKNLIKYLNPNKNKIILDLGCGNGSFARYLMANGYQVYGTDASENGIAIANSLNPGFFAVQDLSSDDLPPEFAEIKFDTIVSTEVIEHLYNPRAFVSFAKAILSKNGGGEIMISTPYHGFLKNLALSLTNSWEKHLGPLWDGGHIKFWSKNTLNKLLTEQGFTITGFVGCGRLPFLWKSMIVIAKL